MRYYYYKKIVADLKSTGLIINPYDPCVANIMVNGNHMTITWHIYDLKISRIDAYEATKVIYWMKGIYIIHMKEYHGKKYDYLGMDLDFSVDG